MNFFNNSQIMIHENIPSVNWYPVFPNGLKGKPEWKPVFAKQCVNLPPIVRFITVENIETAEISYLTYITPEGPY